jgi:hypothetical protein
VKILPLPKKQIWDLQMELTPKEELTELGMMFLMKVMEKDQEQGGFHGGGFSGGRPVECATQ